MLHQDGSRSSLEKHFQLVAIGIAEVELVAVRAPLDPDAGDALPPQVGLPSLDLGGTSYLESEVQARSRLGTVRRVLEREHAAGAGGEQGGAVVRPAELHPQ